MLVALLTALLASLVLAIPALAVVNTPPQLPHEVVIFPERDFVVADGYAANTDLNFTLRRNGVVIGTASGTTDGAGFLEVNHPGGVCWNNFTPNVLPEDTVEVVDNAGNGDSSRTINVSAEQAQIVGTDVLVHGTAQDAAGNRIPLGLMEQRIIQPAFRDTPGSRITRRDIRADTAGGSVPAGATATLRYDAPGSNNWTATYSGLNATERDLAVSGQTRVLSWLAANAAGDRLGITIFEVGEVGGPGFGGCPASADYAVTNTNKKPAINKANVGRNLVLSGVAQDATDVTVTLNDQSAVTPAVTATGALSAASGAQTWRAVVPSAKVSGLKDGTLTASGSYTLAGGTVSGVNLRIAKDTVAPRPPRATPKAGVYKRPQSVTLSAQPRTKIRYTVSGRRPGLNSPIFRRQIRVTSSQRIRAIAVDKANNRSTIANFRYVIR